MWSNFHIKKNEFGIPLTDIISIAYTPKKQRRFYLLNKLVGNHLEVKPNVIRAVGAIFADMVYHTDAYNKKLLSNYITNEFLDEDIIQNEVSKYICPKEKTFVIGLAESATAIGMATAASIKDSYYISTSREDGIPLKSLFDFEEEHTIITKHKCYLQNDVYLKNADRIIVVEDEITTGNTMINLLKKLIELSNAKKIDIVSILDFSNEGFLEKLKELGKKHDVEICFNALLHIAMNYEGLNNVQEIEDTESTLSKDTEVRSINFPGEMSSLGGNSNIINPLGVLGCTFETIRSIEKTALKIAKEINLQRNEKIIVVGHSENMYLPSRIGYYLSNKSLFKSTTKSYIQAINNKEYPIKERSKFDIDGSTYYLYNKSIIEKEYKRVFFVADFDMNITITKNTVILKI